MKTSDLAAAGCLLLLCSGPAGACSVVVEVPVIFLPSDDPGLGLLTTSESMIALLRRGDDARVLWSRELEFRPSSALVAPDAGRVVLFNAGFDGAGEPGDVAVMILDELGHELGFQLVSDLADLTRRNADARAPRWFGSARFSRSGKAVEISTVRPRADLRECFEALTDEDGRPKNPESIGEQIDGCLALEPFETVRLSLETGRIVSRAGAQASSEQAGETQPESGEER